MKIYIVPLLALASLLPSTPGFAALSGFYDSGEQITVIISSATVADAVRQAPIKEISNTGTREDGAHQWFVKTQNCELKVLLIPIPPAGLGKTIYRVDVPQKCE